VRKRPHVVPDTLSDSTIRSSLPGCKDERMFDSDPGTSPPVYISIARMRSCRPKAGRTRCCLLQQLAASRSTFGRLRPGDGNLRVATLGRDKSDRPFARSQTFVLSLSLRTLLSLKLRVTAPSLRKRGHSAITQMGRSCRKSASIRRTVQSGLRQESSGISPAGVLLATQGHRRGDGKCVER
jgi:hypothetical protein